MEEVPDVIGRVDRENFVRKIEVEGLEFEGRTPTQCFELVDLFPFTLFRKPECPYEVSAQVFPCIPHV